MEHAVGADGHANNDSGACVVNSFDPDSTDLRTSNSDTPLRMFLQVSMLSSDDDEQDKTETRAKEVSPSPLLQLYFIKLHRGTKKVTISTCHAAKGLEWPVVMIPSG